MSPSPRSLCPHVPIPRPHVPSQLPIPQSLISHLSQVPTLPHFSTPPPPTPSPSPSVSCRHSSCGPYTSDSGDIPRRSRAW